MGAHRLLVTALLAVAITGCTSSTPRARPGLSPSPGPSTVASLPPAAPPTATATANTRRAAVHGLALNDVQAVGEHVAFVVGEHLILRSDDAGQSWHRQYDGPLDLTQVDMISATHGWAVGDAGVLRTVDGKTWQPVAEPAALTFNTVHFTDRRHGVGITLGEGRVVSSIYATDDGGMSWRGLEMPVDPLDITANSPSDFWVAGKDSVWRSHDAGRSWQRRLSDARPDNTGSVGFGEARLLAAGPDAVWAEFDAGEGAAGQVPWALYAGGDSSPMRRVGRPPRSPYPVVLSPLSRTQAFEVANCPACDDPPQVQLVDVAGHGPGVGQPRVFGPLAMSFGSSRVGYLLASALPPNQPPAPSTVVAVTRDGGQRWDVSRP